ncbi:MAG: DUF2076 domain-containing protein [Pseudomonadota bacterium]|nr:DUF2076 domain-containing protein [Pseudomonadota bacterium]
MKIRKVKHAVAALTLGALAAYQPVAVKADDTAEEIRLLKTRLKQLEEKVAKQDRERKATEAQIRKAAAQQPGAPYNTTPLLVQTPIYAIPKIPGSTDQRPASPLAISIGGPGAPPSYETGGLAGLEAKLKGYPYIGPSSLFVNDVSITPGGFFELASVTRNHFIGADIATPFSNIPFANVPSSHTGEFHLSARRSRAALLVRGDVNPATHLGGYGEFDWLSAAQTANLNQTDSFNLRIRHLYMTVDNDDFGAHFLAGHAFTLATMDIIGILPRKENTPIVIEDQYVPGFVWARQDQIRVVKDFDQKLWFALSAEQPATSFGGVAPTVPTVINVLPGVISPPPGQGTIVGGSLFNSINPLSLNQMPDLIGKVAWDPTIGDRTIHMEAFGIFRNFVDRVVLPVAALAGTSFINHNNNSVGEGVGGSILVPVIPKMLEAQFSGITGRGIGRYGAGQLADVTFRPDGSLTANPETMFLAGLVLHAWPGLDLYAYAGEEYESPNFGHTPLGTAKFVGLGNPAFNNSGCAVELSTVCSGNVREVQSITAGFWQDIYKGPFGRLTGGLEYMYVKKYGFQGIGGEPSRQENMFFTSLRYYPF